MAESIVEQIFPRVRENSKQTFPEHGECRAVRLVGHTPKPEYYLHDAVMEFSDGSERITCKVYRSKSGDSARRAAKRELENLRSAYDAMAKRKLSGVPRPIGDFSELGSVVSTKMGGLPLQSIIMKAALLPGYTDQDGLTTAAQRSGEWLKSFHKALSSGTAAFEATDLLLEMEGLCVSCKSVGLEDRDIEMILTGAKHSLAKARKTVMASAVVNDFTPLNLTITEMGVGVCDYAKMEAHGIALRDVAHFMASIEALEKYPFCNREITSRIQETFLEAYGILPVEQAIVRVMKMEALLKMFAAGRNGKETALRKKIMWANVMKRFIHQAANRTLQNAA